MIMLWMKHQRIYRPYEPDQPLLTRSDAVLPNVRRATDVAGQAGERPAGVCRPDAALASANSQSLRADGWWPAPGRGPGAGCVCSPLFGPAHVAAGGQILDLSVADRAKCLS